MTLLSPHTVVVPWRRAMVGRDPHEPGRVATPLELFFDLVFVAAVAATAAQLHHALQEGHYGQGLGGYLLAFMALWWAWMNYTWFASAYDNDDLVFRLLTLTIMAGALVLAASEADIFAHGQSVSGVLGYVVMRVGMIALWLRAAHGHPERRPVALRYAAGIAVAQAYWVARLFFPEHEGVAASFLVGIALELAVPVLAERHGRTPFHPHHVAERYGLLTLIVLGEVVLATVQAIQGVLRPEGKDAVHTLTTDLWLLIVGAFVLLSSMWWVYFKREHGDLVQGRFRPWLFGYGHYFVFAAAAALGGSLAAGVDVIQQDSHATPRAILIAVALSVSVFVLVLSALRATAYPSPARAMRMPVAYTVVVAAIAAWIPTVGLGVLLMAVTTAALVAQHVAQCSRATHPHH